MSWIDVNGVSIRYHFDGSGENPLVVFFHEIGGSLESFNRVVPYLLPHFSVLSFDQRGAGQSEKVRDSFGIDDLVNDAAELIDYVAGDVQCHLVTIAASGLQALRFYERFDARVRSLTMCNPALGVDPSRAQALEDRADIAESSGIRAGLETTLDKSYQPELRDDKVYPEVRGRYLSNDPFGFAEANRVLARTDMRGILTKLRCPTMVIAGRQDQVRPFVGSEEIATQIPGSRFELIDGGHFLTVTSPDEVGNLLMDFLTSVTQ
ncbi:MAG: alpha/beta fold hydrolase [Acidimicrobiaceae bacterium]|nr:alpha/beta fold hydrolase [Acidimicrobiaceae bacterium]